MDELFELKKEITKQVPGIRIKYIENKILKNHYRDIVMSDIFLVLRKKFDKDYTKDIIIISQLWNLNNPLLENQNKKFIKFLHNLICK